MPCCCARADMYKSRGTIPQKAIGTISAWRAWTQTERFHTKNGLEYCCGLSPASLELVRWHALSVIAVLTDPCDMYVDDRSANQRLP